MPCGPVRSALWVRQLLVKAETNKIIEVQKVRKAANYRNAAICRNSAKMPTDWRIPRIGVDEHKRCKKYLLKVSFRKGDARPSLA